jgi:integrase
MKRSETYRTKPNRYNKAFDGRGRRVRGLWERNGKYYAQIRIKDWVGRVHLEHSSTVAEATTEMQALRARIVAGTFLPPNEVGQTRKNVEQGGSPASTIRAAIAGYVADRDLLKTKKTETCRHENCSFSAWNTYAGDDSLSDIDGKLLKDFAAHRMEVEDDDEKPLSGRTINLNVLALKHVCNWAVVEKWLPKFPENWVWKDLPETPKPVRLISAEELEFLIKVRTITPEALEMIDQSKRYIVEVQQLAGQGFSDYLKLLSLTGAREQETIAKRWTHVRWDKHDVGFPGSLAKAGGGKPAEDRWVDFYDKLEAHLKDMYARRDPSTDYMFPDGNGGHIGSYRKQWEHAREALKQWHIKKGMKMAEAEELCDSLGFHHLRHYFISGCVMRKVDYLTIARWVSHRDGGVLIGRIYGHLRPGHSATQAALLNG